MKALGEYFYSKLHSRKEKGLIIGPFDKEKIGAQKKFLVKH